MISLILIWFYIAIILIIYGIFTVKLLQFLFKTDGQAYPALIIIFILGLCAITTITGYLSLIINLGLWAFAIISLVAFFLFYNYSKDIIELFRGYFAALWAMNKYVIIILVCSIIFILVKSTEPPTAVDTGLYHAQAIKWIEEYPAVPGLGNLHGRLAFNCSWFLDCALFSLSFLKIQPFHVLNPLLLIVVLIMSSEAADDLIKGHNSLANLLKVSIILPVTLIFKDQLSSPVVDLPAALVILVVFIYFVEILEEGRLSSKGLGTVIIAMMAIYAITIKLSSIPITVFIFYICARKIFEKKYRDLILLLGIVFIILIPWAIRNVILSGYLIYPFPSLDLFNFDWKVPLTAVAAESRAIGNYARNPGIMPDAWLSQGLTAWLPGWLHYLATAYRKKLELIFLPSLFILCAIIINALKEKTFKVNYKVVWQYKIIYLTAIIGIVFWFFTAPDLRLGYGFILITPLLLLMIFTKVERPLVGKTVLALTALALLYFEGVFIGGDLQYIKSRAILPAPYPKVALKTIRMGGQVIYTPAAKEGLCWDAPLPCAPGPVANLEFRGDDLQDGFRSRVE